MPTLIRIYSLREDQRYVRDVQRATLETEDSGLLPDPCLFGSAEWWEAIERGDIPTYTINGRISRVFMSGHNDYPEFEIDDGAARTCWTRQASEIPGSSLSRHEMAQMYREDVPVKLSYVLQRFKKPLPGLGENSKCVLGIWVGENAGP